MTVIDTPAGITRVHLLILKGRLKLEILGMKAKGGSTYAMIKKRYGFKGDRVSVLNQFEQHIEEFNKRNGFV